MLRNRKEIFVMVYLHKCLTTFVFLQVSGISEPLVKATLAVIRNEGILALYNGLLPSLIRTFPATGALFCAVEYSKKLMHSL